MTYRNSNRAIRIVVTSVLLSLVARGGLAQTRGFSHGDRVRERIETTPSEPKRIGMLVTVVAVPGDRIRLTNAQVLVNDRPVIGFSVELLTMVAQSNRVPAAMPDDQYLVMGEWRLLDDVVRKWGTYSAKELESASVEARQ